jgi:hypothetical protein
MIHDPTTDGGGGGILPFSGSTTGRPPDASKELRVFFINGEVRSPPSSRIS